MGQEIAAAKVARQTDLGKSRGELGVVGGDSHIAGQGQRQAGAGGGAGNHSQSRLGHFVQPATGLHAHAQVGDLLVEGGRRLGTADVAGKSLHIAAGAKGLARAG